MSVLIKGMEMPKVCYECRMYEANIYYCTAAKRIIDIPSSDEGRCSFCPLVPVPAHGDLIDRDALTDAIESTDWYHQAPNKEMVHGANSAEHQAWYKEQDIYSAIEDAFTIIPAEKEGDGDG